MVLRRLAAAAHLLEAEDVMRMDPMVDAVVAKAGVVRRLSTAISLKVV